MTHAKIALPFNQACKLSDEQKCKLIICQARRVAIQEWEIESLLLICKSKGWIDKGLAVLYEYAGYIDDMKSIMEMRNEMCNSFINEVASQCETDDDNLSTLRKTAAITAKAVYIVCCWRRLQWCPRPIYFEDSILSDIQLSFHNIIRDDSTKLYNTLIQNANVREVVELQLLSIEQLVVLVAPARGLEYSDLEDLLLGSEMNTTTQGDESREGSPQQHAVQLTPRHHALFTEIRDVFSLEDRVEVSWKLIQSNLDDNADPCDTFPTLRLPYKDYRPPTDALVWFNENISQYNSLGAALVAMSKTAEPHTPQMNNTFNNSKPYLQLIETSPVVFSGRKEPEESLSSKIKKKSPHNRRGQPRSYSNEDEELGRIASSVADSRDSRDPPSLMNAAYDESPSGSPVDNSSAFDVEETRSQIVTSPLGSASQEPRKLQKEGSAGSKISVSKSSAQLPRTVMSSPAGSASRISPAPRSADRKRLPSGEPTTPKTPAGSVKGATRKGAKGENKDTLPSLGTKRGGESPKQLLRELTPPTPLNLTSPDNSVHSAIAAGAAISSDEYDSSAPLQPVLSRQISGGGRSRANSQIQNLQSPQGVNQFPQFQAQQGNFMSTPPPSSLPRHLLQANNFMNTPSPGSSSINSGQQQFFSPQQQFLQQSMQQQGFVFGGLTPEQAFFSQQMQLAYQNQEQQFANYQQQLPAHLQRPSFQTFSNNHQSLPPIDVTSTVTEPSARKRSVTIAVVNRPDQQTMLRPHSSSDTIRRSTVAGKVDLATFQEQHAQATGSAGPNSPNRPKLSAPTNDINNSPMLHSAMKKSSATQQSVPPIEMTIVSTPPHSDKTNNRKQVVSPPVALPSQMATMRTGESFSSMATTKTRAGSTEYLYINEDDGPFIAGEEEGRIFQSTPLMRLREGSFSTPEQQQNQHQQQQYQMFLQQQQMVMQQHMSSNEFGSPMYSIQEGLPNSQPRQVYHPQVGSPASYYDISPQQQYAFHSQPVTSRGRVYSADSGLPEYMSNAPISKHRKSAPVRMKKPKSAGPVVTTGFTPMSAKHMDLLRPRVDFLKNALYSVAMRGGSEEYVAASKLAVWWTLLFPRRKLVKRIAIRECILAILTDIIDVSVGLGISRQRRRQALLRQGAAMKIQRCFRYWCDTVLVEEKRKEKIEQVRLAWSRLMKWARAVIIGIKIHRYLKYAQRKKIIRSGTIAVGMMGPSNGSPKMSPGKTSPQQMQSKMLTTRPISFIRKTLENYIQLLTLSKKLELQQQLILKMGDNGIGQNSKRTKLYKERDKAATVVQSYYRRHTAIRMMKNRKVFNIMQSKITMFFVRGIARRRLNKRKKLYEAAVRIQTFFRGIIIRKRIFELVSSGLRLNAMWRKHRAYKSLKSQLRRVDRPHTLVVHGLRNISKKFVSNDTMRFKLSVWWNPLLHIVSQNDFDTIIQSKQPQFIYNSSSHPVTDDEPVVDTTNTFSRSLKNMSKLSTSLVTGGGAIPSIESASNRSSIAGSVSGGVIGGVTGGSKLAVNPYSSLKDVFHDIPHSPNIKGHMKDSFSDIAGGSSASSSAGNSPMKPSALERKESVIPLKPSALMHLANFAEDDEDDEDGESNKGSSMASRSHTREQATRDHYPKTPPKGNYNYGIKEDHSGDSHTQGHQSKGSYLRNRLGESMQLSRQLNDKDVSEGAEKQLDEKGDAASSISSSSMHDLLNHSASAGGTIHPHHVNGSHSSTTDGDQNSIQSQQYKNSIAARKFSPSIKRPSIFTRTAVGMSINLRSTINFAMKLGQVARKQTELQQNPKFVCNFEDETVKIPGCHGNSVFKFEVLEGERKFAAVYFYLSKEGEMMYWGGEYQKEMSIITQKRAIQFNAHTITTARETTTKVGLIADAPVLEFRVIAGAPLRSRCQWGRMVVRGNGPLKRSLNSKDMMGSFLFDKWHRFYMSLDEFSFDLYDNKFSTLPYHSIPVKDLKEVRVDIGTPIRSSKAASKNIVEDITNVILTTTTGDELYMRFQDSGSRVAWQEVLGNAVEYNKKSSGSKHKHWLAKLIGAGDDDDDDGNGSSSSNGGSPVHKSPTKSPAISTGGGFFGFSSAAPVKPAVSGFTAMVQKQITEGARAGVNAPTTKSRMPPIFAVQHASKMAGK